MQIDIMSRGLQKQGQDNLKKQYNCLTRPLRSMQNIIWVGSTGEPLKINFPDFEEALADFNEAIKLDSRYTPAWYNRAISKYGSKDYTGALADCNYFITQQPNYAVAYDVRGFI